jgi:hypothetical protein
MWMMRKEASTWKENWLQPYTIDPEQAKILVRTRLRHNQSRQGLWLSSVDC